VTVFELIRTKRAVGYPLPSYEQSHAPKPNGRKPFDEVVSREHWEGQAKDGKNSGTA
jgi:hypothetical protein